MHHANIALKEVNQTIYTSAVYYSTFTSLESQAEFEKDRREMLAVLWGMKADQINICWNENPQPARDFYRIFVLPFQKDFAFVLVIEHTDGEWSPLGSAVSNGEARM